MQPFHLDLARSQPGTYAVVDIEATGMDPSRHEIIEIAVVVFNREREIERFASLVKPRGRLSLDIATLTGISAADLAQAPPLSEIAPRLRQLVGRLPIVGHSVDQDIAMLDAAGLTLDNPLYDTHDLATLLLADLPVASLSAVARRLDVPTTEGHRALDDALTTAAVFRALLDRIDRFDDATLERVAALTAAAGWPVAALFAAAVAGRPRGPLFAQPDDARGAHELAFLTTRERPDPLRRTGSGKGITRAEIAAALGARGALSQVLPGYEHRAAQERMALAVARALNGDGRVLVEAGTGTGKSVAYLLPAVLHARERGETVVVSTNTLALQDQLFTKDIPILQRALGDRDGAPPFEAAVLKGRSNYLCLRRWFAQQRQPVHGPAEAQVRAKVTLWLSETESGDRAELRLTGEEEAVFRHLSADGEACVPARCPYQQRNQCFLFRARRAAEHAHVVVANHALLLSDMQEGSRVLPDYERLIIDEAHHLEDQATSHFGFAVGEAAVVDLLDDMLRVEGATVGGALPVIAGHLTRCAATDADRRRAARSAERLTEVQRQESAIRSAVLDLFGRLADLIQMQDHDRGGYDRTLRITSAVRRDGLWAEVELAWEQLDGALRNVEGDLAWYLEALEEAQPAAGDALAAEREDLTIELAAQLRAAADLRAKLREALSAPTGEAVYWIERSQQTGRVTVHAAPLHVGDLLGDRLFDGLRTLVLTSATMTIDGSFDYVRERLGLHDADELALPSPFDYERSTLLYIADDIPEPNAPGYQRRVEAALVDLCAAMGGQTLVLFTSHAALLATYRAIRGPLEARGVIVLAQRVDGSPRQLIERLKQTPNVVVLGTATFWEGVDVVGNALSALVIAKLPFAVPSDPVFAARSEQFDEPFLSYAVPQAVLKFKQGFGRLIRSSQDRGVCAVFDRRVISKRYGASFVQSLPPCSVTVGAASDLPQAAVDWLGRSKQRFAS